MPLNHFFPSFQHLLAASFTAEANWKLTHHLQTLNEFSEVSVTTSCTPVEACEPSKERVTSCREWRLGRSTNHSVVSSLWEPAGPEKIWKFNLRWLHCRRNQHWNLKGKRQIVHLKKGCDIPHPTESQSWTSNGDQVKKVVPTSFPSCSTNTGNLQKIHAVQRLAFWTDFPKMLLNNSPLAFFSLKLS